MNSVSPLPLMNSSAGALPFAIGADQAIMAVLLGIRPLQASGLPYDASTNLTDAGFTSIEMVKVMLGVEAAFDLMIPQEMITPENFTSATTISRMIQQLVDRN